MKVALLVVLTVVEIIIHALALLAAVFLFVSGAFAAGSIWSTTPRYHFRWMDYSHTIADLDSVGRQIDTKLDQFKASCYAYQKHKQCDQIITKKSIQVVDDFTFYCGDVSSTGLCGGENGGSNILVIRWNKINATDPSQCAGSPIVRTRQQMYELSGGNPYWLSHPSPYFCANLADPMPALVHELCHAFGAKVGHVSGFADCQKPK